MHRLLIWIASLVTGLALIAAAAAIARRARGPFVERSIARAHAALAGWQAPVVCGLLTAAVVWWCWGSLNQVPVYDDERAYVLQAEIFAAGHWTAPAPVESQFFQQLHVLESPAVAAKYPPGQSLLMVPGVWLGLPGLVPVCLSALAGALVYALARRLAGAWVGLSTWFIWLTQPATVQWRATYFSETTTATLWLVGWWALLTWRRGRQPWALALLGVVVGWGAITRPLTMLAFALPVAAVVVRDTVHARQWVDLGVGLVPSLAVLAIIPLWSARTTGNWRETPVARYTRDYIPWDHPGFGYDSTAPRRSLPPDLDSTAATFVQLNRRHTAHMLPTILAERTGALTGEFGRGWRRVLIVFAVVGLVGLGGEALVGVGTAVLLVVAYLSYVHFSNWTVYYLELWPVPAFLAARGLWAWLRAMAPTRAALAVTMLLLAALPAAWLALADTRRERAERTRPHELFRAALARLGPGPVLVFVRYGPEHRVYAALVGNTPDPATAHAWIAYDEGDRDSDLVARAAGRRPYLYDERRASFAPFDARGTVPSR